MTLVQQGSSTIEAALHAAGFGQDVEYDETNGQLTLYGNLYEMANDISSYAVRDADPGTQDSELLAESIRYIANNGRGENKAADAISGKALNHDRHRSEGKGKTARS